MGKEPDDIRRDIEQTRERMAETLDALAYKADVPARAKEAITQTKESVAASATEAKERVKSSLGRGRDARASGRTERPAGSQGAGAATGRIARRAEDNPLAIALGSVAAGFVLGSLLPATSAEAELIGPLADRLKDRTLETSREALERGRQFALERAGTALGTR